MYNTLQGAEDILAADDKGLVISVDVSTDGKAGEELHLLQEAYYMAKPEVDDKAWNDFLNAEAAYQERLIQEQLKKQHEAEEELQKHQAELKKIKDEYFGNNAVEDKQEFDKAMALLDEQYKAEYPQKLDEPQRSNSTDSPHDVFCNSRYSSS